MCVVRNTFGLNFFFFLYGSSFDGPETLLGAGKEISAVAVRSPPYPSCTCPQCLLVAFPKGSHDDGFQCALGGAGKLEIDAQDIPLPVEDGDGG